MKQDTDRSDQLNAASGARSTLGAHPIAPDPVYKRNTAGKAGAARGKQPSRTASAQGKRHRKSPKSRKGKGTLVALGIACAVIGIAYVAGAVVFSRISYPATVIAGVDVSLMDAPSIETRIEWAAEDYSLTVEGDGFSWTYEPQNTSELIDAKAIAERTIASNDPLAWPIRLLETLTGGKTPSRDSASHGAAEADDSARSALPEAFDLKGFDDKLREAIEAFNANRPGTLDAPGAYDEATGKFSAERALSNRKLDADMIADAAVEAVATLEPKLELDDSYFVPLAGGATKSELEQACDEANALIGTDVNLKMGGSVVATLDGAQLAQWMTFDENLNPVLNTEQVSAWVRELASSTLDTAGTERTYTRPDGKQVTVAGGTFGWISDEASLTKMLQDAVKNKQVGDIDVPVKQSGDRFSGKGQADWGSYVDIDLTEQHARYYDASGNLLWESGIISGNPNQGNATPTGVYKLNSNNGPSTLIGKKDPETGEPEYRTPVEHWMPFVGNAVGLHDASWQPAWAFSSPTAYQSLGSHGCVNLPPDKASELSAMIKTGTCIISHL